MEARNVSEWDRQPWKPMTFKQYMNLPEDMHVELIDGELVALAAPTFRHHELSGEIFTRLRTYLRGTPCRAIQDITIHLEKSDTTHNGVRPDISVVCEPEKIQNGIIVGAPTLVVEILSPSTSKNDTGKKLRLYQKNGVLEYWIVHQESEEIVQCVLIDGQYQMKPIFEGTVVSTSIEGFTLDIRDLYDSVIPLENAQAEPIADLEAILASIEGTET